MGTIADKLQLLQENKEDIRAAIEEKGQSVPATTPLSAYGDKIRAIQTGADTSDATAAAGDILSGKTAYVNGGKVTGTMPEVAQATPSISVSSAGLITASATQEAGHVASGTKSATRQLTTQGGTIITPETSDKIVVPAERYTIGDVVVAGDANLIAENIKKGVSIFGVIGSYAKEWNEVVGAYQSGNSITFENVPNAEQIREFFVIANNPDGGFRAVISTHSRYMNVETSGTLPTLGSAYFFQNIRENEFQGFVNYHLHTMQVDINQYNDDDPYLSLATQFLLLYKL